MNRSARMSVTATCILLIAVLPGLLASPALGQQPERVKVLIAFGNQPGSAEEAMVRGMGGSVKYTYHLVPAIAATLPEHAVSALMAHPHVTRVEPDRQMRALDTELDNSWGVKWIGAGSVHGGNKGDGVKLAIIDSGINYNHPDLNDNYLAGGGYDFVEDDGEPMDVYGHGTHVAGTACAEDNDNGVPEGPYGVVGVAPECALYALRVLDDNGFGDASDLIAALQWAVDSDIQVANLSLGWDLNPGDTVQAAFDNAWADEGLVIVAAACNNGNRPGKGDNVCYPALYDSVIAVAATDASDQRASFSSTGDQVELAAPGVSVFSTWNDGTGYYDPPPKCHTEEGIQACYKYGSGTSMASPHVAGTAALILAANPDWTNDQVRARLRATADDLGATGWDPHYGYGLVDAAEAVDGPANEPPTVSITNPNDGASFDSGFMIPFEGTASDPEEGDLTDILVWTSSIQGPVGVAGTFSTILEDGNHTITASVTDSGGSTASDSITVMVGGGGTMYVFAIDMSSKRSGPNRSGIAVVTIKDTDGDLVAGATVHGTWSDDYSGSASGVTDTDGAVRFETGKVRHAATFTFMVNDVHKSGYTYDSGLNNQTSATIDVP